MSISRRNAFMFCAAGFNSRAIFPSLNPAGVDSQGCKQASQLRTAFSGNTKSGSFFEEPAGPSAQVKYSQNPIIIHAILESDALEPNDKVIGRATNNYSNRVDLTVDYISVINKLGNNYSLTDNRGRTGIYASRRRIIHNGQGDFAAYNASLRITSKKEGAKHWLANPAASILNGTIIGDSDGCYLNPIELLLTDKLGSGNPKSVAAIGFVANLNRNAPARKGLAHGGAGLGEVWSGIRIQSTGASPVDNILTAIGPYRTGIDLSMDECVFDKNRAAVALKGGDRIYFNAKASAVDDEGGFIRPNWRATEGFDDYIAYDVAQRAMVIVTAGRVAMCASERKVTFSPTSNAKMTFDQGGLSINDVPLLSGRISGWQRVKAEADHSTNFDEESSTLRDAWRRIRALEDALHELGGVNAILGE